MKFYLILSALVVGSFASSVYMDLKGQKKGAQEGRSFGRSMDDGEQGKEGSAKSTQLFSDHIPFYLTPLNLTPGELKAFAGHSFQFIKAKCPAVPQGKIDSLGKYVAKLISQADPKPERSAVVTELIANLAKCSKNKVTEANTPTSENSDSFWKRYFGSIMSVGTRKDGDGKESTPTPTEAGSDDEVTVTLPAQTGYYIPNIHSVFWTDSDPDSESTPTTSSSSWNPFKWFGNIFNSMREFTAKLFGLGPEATRERRDVLNEEETKVDQGTEQKSMVDDMVKLMANPMEAQDAFIQLFDNLCRIYCRSCPNVFPPTNFKAAAKELLQFILKDESGSKLAAQHYLDTAFLQALNDC